MAGSSFGTILKVTTFGESHGIGLGAVLDGCPAGLPVNEEIIQQYLNLRKPGQTKYSTPRKEQDKIRILSGVFEGRTTGTPILLLAENETQRSQDYSEIASYYRPGHADFTFDAKYGFRDYRGGGRSSGRETLGRVAAGAIAIEFLKTLGIEICAYTKSIGSISCQKNDYAASLAEDNRASGTALSDRLSRKGLDRLRSDKLASPLYMPDADASLWQKMPCRTPWNTRTPWVELSSVLSVVCRLVSENRYSTSWTLPLQKQCSPSEASKGLNLVQDLLRQNPEALKIMMLLFL